MLTYRLPQWPLSGDISHLLMFGFRLRNCGKVWKISIRFLIELLYPWKLVESSAYIVNKKQQWNISIPLINSWLFIKAKGTVIIKKYWVSLICTFFQLKVLYTPYLRHMILDYLITLLPILWNYF